MDSHRLLAHRTAFVLAWRCLAYFPRYALNLMRSVLAEFGIAIPVGLERALQLARQIVDEEADLDLPTEATNIVTMLSGQMLQLPAQLRKLDLRLAALQRSEDTARRLATIPGIAPVGATALAASVADPG